MRKNSFLGKILKTLDRRWTINSKKESDFDKAVDLTFADVTKYIEKHSVRFVSRFSFQTVHENSVFGDVMKTQDRIAKNGFLQVLKNVFKNGRERCIPMAILLDMLEVTLDTQFFLIPESMKMEPPPRGVSLTTIK